VQDVKQTAQQKSQQFSAKAKDATPESASAGAGQVASVAEENPVPVALAGAFVAGLVVGWILSR
jgi:F0F1-type ATP synthase assembly protein I